VSPKRGLKGQSGEGPEVSVDSVVGQSCNSWPFWLADLFIGLDEQKCTHPFSLRGWLGGGTGCSERLWKPHPWRYSRPSCLGPSAAWSSTDLVVGNPVCGTGLELGDLCCPDSSHSMILSFCDPCLSLTPVTTDLKLGDVHLEEMATSYLNFCYQCLSHWMVSPTYGQHRPCWLQWGSWGYGVVKQALWWRCPTWRAGATGK